MNRIPTIFKVVFETSPGLICLLDKNIKVLFINTLGSSKLGYEPDELIGLDLINPQRLNYSEFKRYWEAVSSKTSATLEMELETRQGLKTHWEFT